MGEHSTLSRRAKHGCLDRASLQRSGTSPGPTVRVVVMHSLAFVLAAAALAAEAEPQVLKQGIAMEPEVAYLLEGWIQVSSGEARLEAEVTGAGGKIAGRSSTPPVPAGAGWTYTAAETDPL